MSYKDNIRRTQVELAVASQMQAPWPMHVKASRMKFLTKLQVYANRVGSCVFDEEANPATMGTNIGYAGEKLKQRMRKAKSFFIRKKAPKISREFYAAFSFSLMTGYRVVITEKMVPSPALEPAQILIKLASRVLLLRNNKKGSMTFYGATGETIAHIPFVCDDTLSTEEVLATWDNLTIASSATGQPRPFIRAPRKWAAAQEAKPQ